jgi:hypothetical protein
LYSAAGTDDSFGDDQVVRRSELDIGLLARYYKDAASSPLDEGGIVGRDMQALFETRIGFTEQTLESPTAAETTR